MNKATAPCGIYAHETLKPELDKLDLEFLTAEETHDRFVRNLPFKTAQHWFLPFLGMGLVGTGLYGTSETMNDDDQHHVLAVISEGYKGNFAPEEVCIMTLAVTAYEPGIRQALGIQAGEQA